MKLIIALILGCIVSCSTTPITAIQVPALVNDINPDYCSGRPGYPRKAASERVGGWVILAFEIDNAGAPTDIDVIASSPEGYFENAAIGLIQQCKFSHKMNRIVGEKYQYLAKYQMG